MSERRVVSLDDIYASTCGICGERATWGIAHQSGPEGCREAINRGETYCEKHLPVEPDPAMNKWIEELKTENGLIDPDTDDLQDTAICYINGEKEILLHDSFTPEQLDALSDHMKKYTIQEKK